MPETIANAIFILFCLGFLTHLLFYGFIYSRLAFGRAKQDSGATALPPVSVVICARNEENFLEKNLQYVLEQDYPEYEVIVVNDCSWDGTQRVLEEYRKKYSNLRTLMIQEDNIYKHGKKLALTVGIRSAKYEYMVFTDADCRPANNQWLKALMSAFDDNTEIVLGYGAYDRRKGIINRLIRMDTFQIGLHYLSLAVAGMPYMGVGRNLAYRKSLFFKQKGFAPYSHIPSGDDDLFINKAATRANTKIALGCDSITISEPKESIKEWVRQKRRHVSTARYYKSSSLIVLGMKAFGQYLYLLSFIALLFTPWWQTALTLVALMLVIQLFVSGRAMKKLGEADLLVYSPIIEWLLLLAFYPGIALSNMLFKRVSWKT